MADFTDPLLAELGRERPSGYQQAMGYRLAAWSEGEAVLLMEVGPQHLNRAGVVHGGVLASLVDTACGFAGSFAAVPGEQPKVSTLTLATSFVAPARGGPLRATGRVRGGGRSVFFAAAEIHDAGGALVAYGEGSFRYHRGARPESVEPSPA
jgi:uncharacterized protein (TIGR00369 family)